MKTLKLSDMNKRDLMKLAIWAEIQILMEYGLITADFGGATVENVNTLKSIALTDKGKFELGRKVEPSGESPLKWYQKGHLV